MFGERTDRDVINPGFGVFAQDFLRHVAGNFQPCLAVGALHGFTHLFGGEVIQHDDIRAGFQGVIQLFQRFHLDFNRHIRMHPEGLFNGLTYRTRSDNMVLFDQKCIGKAKPVVRAAAAQYRVFQRSAQPRQCFAGIQ